MMSLFRLGLYVAMPASISSWVIYTHSADGRVYNVSDCEINDAGHDFFGGNPAQLECMRERPVLEHLGSAILDNLFDSGNLGRQRHIMCSPQKDICRSLPELQDLPGGCTSVYSGCQQALRHLTEMLFKPDGEPQVCNNFARKSVRGMFHDLMSSGIDGSILDEHTISINFGLCRWAQYINVLSDATTCDPGSIIAMAGMLGYEACGAEVWALDHNTKPVVTIGRGFPCMQNIDNDLFDIYSEQRFARFSDTQAAANATAMEEFWYALNGDRGNGEIEYSGEASAHAHAIGRVTCQPDGTDNEGYHVPFKPGFFHTPRTTGNTVQQDFREALNKLGDTQCTDRAADCESDGGIGPTPRGLRLNTDMWTLQETETDFNPEGGLCGMPTQFLGTVHVGNGHRMPRWLSIFQGETGSGAYTAFQSRPTGGCTQTMQMFIPWERMNITNHALPTSAALTRFLDIAWDGVDSIASAWDSCENACMIPIRKNRLCGADFAAGVQLDEYDWNLPYCDAATGVRNGDRCCDLGCGGACRYDNGDCEGRPGGMELCCPNRITTTGRECTSSDDTGCVIPAVGNGASCSIDDDCDSGSCKGGRCCNAHGQGTGCTSCDVQGNCDACSADPFTVPNGGGDGGTCNGCNYTLKGPDCISSCDCHGGCTNAGCNCGCCTECGEADFMDLGNCSVWEGAYPSDICGVCAPRRPVGAKCSVNAQCVNASAGGSGGDCRGGNCCDAAALQPGCTDCNFRGLCEACDEPTYTLCGVSGAGGSGGYGQCNLTIAGGSGSLTSTQSTAFICGTGLDGDNEGHPMSFSTNGWNYCGGGHCPCATAGCYQQCMVEESCWFGSDAATIHNSIGYHPPEFPVRLCSGENSTSYCHGVRKWWGPER